MQEPTGFGDEPNRIVRQYCHLIRSGGRVFDVGAGGGRDTIFLARKGYQTLAVDRNSEAVAYTRQRLADEGLEAVVECADVRDLPFPGETADGVIVIGTLNGVRRAAAETLLRNIAGWLLPGGVAILTAMLNTDPVCEEHRRAGVRESVPGEFEIEAGRYRTFFAPREIPAFFPGWQVHHLEEKEGMVSHVGLYVLEKPDRE